MGKVARTISKITRIASIVLAFIPGMQPIAAALAVSSALYGYIGKKSAKGNFQGSVSQIAIGANMPLPYAMGRTYLGGNLVYDVGYGGDKNSDRSQVFTYSCAGPIDSFESFQGDFSSVGVTPSGGTFSSAAASGFYSGFLWVDARKGARPDTALASPSGRPAITGWGSAYKLSGIACAMATMKFDDKGKVFSSGLPQFGAVFKGVMAYDPRLDSTYPGGSGSQRWADESTWTWTENAALHALTYARGRYVGTVKVVGAGIPQASIDVPAFVALANICDTNAWKVGGAVYEGPNISKWDNLGKILEAAASEPAWVGGILTCVVSAPKTSLDTIGVDDLADGDIRIQTSSAWRDRINTVVARWRSEGHKWDYVQTDAVTGSTYVTEDGETKTQEVQFDLVQIANQAAKLAAYKIVNSREFGPITLTLKPEFMSYYPGEALTINLPELGLSNQLALITGRQVNPESGTVALTFQSETTAKHSFALGKTTTAPPTPTIITPAVRDGLGFANAVNSAGDAGNMIAAANTVGRVTLASGATLGTNPADTTRPMSAAWVDISALNAKVTFNDTIIPVFPSERIYWGFTQIASASGSDQCIGVINYYKNDGTACSTPDSGNISVVSMTTMNGVYFTAKGSVVVPADCAGIELTATRPTTASGGTIKVGEPYLGRSDRGADITTAAVGPSTGNVDYDSTGTTIQATLDLAYKMAASSGFVTSGVTATYKVLDGTINGFNSTSGSQTLTVTSGTAVLTVSSMSTATGTIQVDLTYAGATRSIQTAMTRTLLPASGGGGGGAGTASQSSGFTATATPWNTFTAITSVLTLAVPAGKTGSSTAINLTAKWSPKTGQAVEGPWNIEFKLQRSPVGAGTWTDKGSVQNSNPDPYLDSGVTPTLASGGTMAATITDTVTASTSYDYRVVARISTGTTTGNTGGLVFTGTVAITCP